MNVKFAIKQRFSINQFLKDDAFFIHNQLFAKDRLPGQLLLILVGLLFSLATVAAEKIPKANGHPDFSGIWQTTSLADYDLEPHSLRKDAPPGAGIVEGDVIPYLPKALEQKKQNFENRLTDDPRLKGWTLGVPRGIYYPEPFQIFQRPRDITIFHQFGHSVRTIHTNNTQHPEDPNDWWMGDSRGHWEKDTLVVDIKHFNDGTWFDRAGNFHSDALHVIERWKFLDANTIEYKATIEDEKVFSRPWNISVILHRHREKDFQIIEDYRYTLGYDKYYPYPAEAAPTAATESQPLTNTINNPVNKTN